MTKVRLSKIMRKGKSLLLAYDQGLEHGPTDFNDLNVDPAYVLEIAKKGRYSGVILQKGIAEKYYDGGVPLIVKLNGKTSLVKGDPISPQLCTVKEAIELGASAIGYTIYVGSVHEPKMFTEFELIQREAHKAGLPIIAWMYPRGKAIKNELDKAVLAYSARIGLELGADIVKMKYNGNINDLRWVVKSAGKVKVLIAGGKRTTEKKILQEAVDAMKGGACGLAIGRNVWQHKEPLKMTKALKKIIFEDSGIREAARELK